MEASKNKNLLGASIDKSVDRRLKEVSKSTKIPASQIVNTALIEVLPRYEKLAKGLMQEMK